MSEDGTLVLSMLVGLKYCGVFLRGPRGADPQITRDLMDFKGKELALELQGDLNLASSSGHYLVDQIEVSLSEESSWDDIISWLENHRQNYLKAIKRM